MQQSFIFGGNTPWTYEQLQRKREIADAMQASLGTPKNVGEGLAAIGKALAIRGINKRADKRDADLKGEFDKKWGSLFGGGTEAATPYTAPTPTDPNSPQGIAADAMTALGKSPEQVIRAGLIQRGLPEHVADGFIMNFRDESGLNPGVNEAKPLVPGSRGGYGLAQWTGPRRVALEQFAQQRGAPASDPNVQLDFLMQELQGPEAKAAQSILSAPDAGSAASAIAKDFLRPSQENLDRRLAEYGGGSPVNAMDIGALADIAGSPYATPGQKAIVGALMQQQMRSYDPSYNLDLENKRLQNEALRNPTQKDTRTDDMREYEYAKSQGFGGTFTDFMTAMRKAGAANQSVTVGADGGVPANDAALRKKLGEKEGEVWSSYLEAGTVSAGTVQDMQLLDEILPMAPQGPVVGRIANAFPGVSSAADAFNSIVKRVAPTLRAPGSGSTSDIEYDGMLKSLPQLSARPEANRAIAAMMKAKAEINVQRAEVVRAAQNDEISVKEARRMMSELDQKSIMTPELKAILGEMVPSGDAVDGYTIEEVQ